MIAPENLKPSDRDPRADPRPGDILVGDGLRRHVFRREGDLLRIGDAISSYRMRLDHWRVWCEKSGAEAAAVANQEC
jgi:hypothetical protein